MLKKLHQQKPAVVIVTYYVGFIFLATLILKLPFLLNPGQEVSWLDAFFMSNSSVATTGLVTLDYTQVYNYLGWIVYILLFNIGGMGIIVLNTVIILFLGKKIGYKQRVLAKMDYNQSGEVYIVSVLKNVVRFFIGFEIIGIILIFLKTGYMYDNFIDRLMNAMFMASSAISGSGFYNTVPYIDDYFVQWVLIFLMIFSFIGYPVIIDISEWIKAKKNKKKYRFSSFTKLVVKVNVITVVMFMLIFLVFEYGTTLEPYNIVQKMQYSFYLSISTKSVGLNLFADITEWQEVTLFFHTIFMLIGGSPSSACGGIKVTAIYICVKHIKNMLLGKQILLNGGYEIAETTILKSYVLIVLFVGLAILGTVIIYLLEPSLGLGAIWYDVVSGFTTTGFSTGALAQMGSVSIFIIAILMGIGRIGIMNLINMSHPKNKRQDRVKYIKKDIAI